MGRALFAFAGNDVIRTASSITATSEQTDFVATNLLDDEPQNPWIATSGTATLNFYLPSTATPVLVSAINYNWNGATAITFGNSAGFVTSLTNNAPGLDGHCENTWKILTGANRASTQFFLTITGANTFAALGAIAICTSYTAIPMQWDGGSGPEFGLDYPDNSIETFSKSLLIYSKGVRQRTLSGTAIRDAGRSILQLGAASAHGRTRPFLVIPDEDVVTGAMWMRFANTNFRYTRTGTNVSRTAIDLLELCSGLPL